MILLDEPAGGVNPTMINQLAERIRTLNKSGVTFLIVEHNMEFVMRLVRPRDGDAPWREDRGGTPEEVRKNPAVLEAYLGD